MAHDFALHSIDLVATLVWKSAVRSHNQAQLEPCIVLEIKQLNVLIIILNQNK